MAWEDPFDRPVRVTEAKSLRTLACARDYILSLSPERQQTYRALVAIESLVMAATGLRPIIDAQIRMMKLIQQENDLNSVREISVSNISNRPQRRSRASSKRP